MWKDINLVIILKSFFLAVAGLSKTNPSDLLSQMILQWLTSIFWLLTGNQIHAVGLLQYALWL